MIDRLYGILPHLEHLPSEAQEEIATYIETLIAELERKRTTSKQYRRVQPTETWIDPFGSCSDLPDTMLEDLDQQRHASPPTLPIELP